MPIVTAEMGHVVPEVESELLLVHVCACARMFPCLLCVYCVRMCVPKLMRIYLPQLMAVTFSEALCSSPLPWHIDRDFVGVSLRAGLWSGT